MCNTFRSKSFSSVRGLGVDVVTNLSPSDHVCVVALKALKTNFSYLSQFSFVRIKFVLDSQ